MELRNQQADALVSDLKNKEKIREKGFAKHVKDGTKEKNILFSKWSTRRNEAKLQYQRHERDKEDDSYLT